VRPQGHDKIPVDQLLGRKVFEYLINLTRIFELRPGHLQSAGGDFSGRRYAVASPENGGTGTGKVHHPIDRVLHH
jgi:hypothetical protein